MNIDNSQNNNDEVILSNTAKDIQLAKKHLGDVSPEHLARLSQLERKVSSGTYHVEAKKIAQKMLEGDLQS